LSFKRDGDISNSIQRGENIFNKEIDSQLRPSQDESQTQSLQCSVQKLHVKRYYSPSKLSSNESLNNIDRENQCLDKCQLEDQLSCY